MVHGLETLKRLNDEAAAKAQTKGVKELPRYKSHKVVHALKIHNIDLDPESGAAVITPENQGYGPFPVDAEYMGKHKPRIGGYYIVYEDGYKSWSPAEAFENGYVKVESAHSPLSELQAALQADENYAWTWQCNLACIGMDCGGDHETANRYAAQFMKNAFGVDVTTQENWKGFEAQWANKNILAWSEMCDRLLNTLQTLIDCSRKRTNGEITVVADRLAAMGAAVENMELGEYHP